MSHRATDEWVDEDLVGMREEVSDEPADPLEAFADAGYITDVISEVKTGKEATVYCCRAHPSTGRELLAAKVYEVRAAGQYRTREFYSSGRQRMYRPDGRAMRALKAKTKRGRELVFRDWVSQEYENLKLLHRVGADVPQPFHQCGSAILMDYIGDTTRPAPTLVGASLSPDESRALFDGAMKNICLFLANDRVHGDLSPYNILLWDGRLVIIDLPQMVLANWNDAAFEALKRDIENVVTFFGHRGVRASAAHLAIDLWTRYLRAQLRIE